MSPIAGIVFSLRHRGKNLRPVELSISTLMQLVILIKESFGVLR